MVSCDYQLSFALIIKMDRCVLDYWEDDEQVILKFKRSYRSFGHRIQKYLLETMVSGQVSLISSGKIFFFISNRALSTKALFSKHNYGEKQKTRGPKRCRYAPVEFPSAIYFPSHEQGWVFPCRMKDARAILSRSGIEPFSLSYKKASLVFRHPSTIPSDRFISRIDQIYSIFPSIMTDASSSSISGFSFSTRIFHLSSLNW